MPFTVPEVVDNPTGWGPSLVPDEYREMPYAPFSKGDRLGKAADWGSQGQHQGRYGRNQQGSGAVNVLFHYHHVDDDDEFTLVDTAPKPRNKYTRFRHQPHTNRRYQNDRDRRRGAQGNQQGKKGRQQGQSRFNRRWKNWGSRRWGNYGYEQKRTLEASVEIQREWELIDTIEFSSLNSLTQTVDEPENLRECGSLECYDPSYESVTTKSDKPLERIVRTFFKVTTSDDPVIRDLAGDGAGNVFATDAMLSLLMSCSRSVYPWDIVVNRVGDTLILDKRENSRFDYLTVNETAQDMPTEEKDSLNNWDSLSQEATFINQNFSQQVLSKNSEKFEAAEPNPFKTDDEEDIASVLYRYRRWDLDDGIKLVARTEVDGVRMVKGAPRYMVCRALNEFDPKVTNVDWRQKLDTQRGAVLATELKNNSNKLACWAVQAHLASARDFLLGYVSRVNPKDNYNHVIIGAQMYNPKEFAQQIRVDIDRCWGTLKAIIERCMKLDEGKYLLLKDPNKAEMHLYRVPHDAFENEDDEDGDIGE